MQHSSIHVTWTRGSTCSFDERIRELKVGVPPTMDAGPSSPQTQLVQHRAVTFLK